MNIRDATVTPLAWLTISAGLFSALAYDGCQRWDCPCAGVPRHALPRLKLQKRVIDIPLMIRTATDSRKYTRSLLNQMEQHKFRSNTDHVASLRRCLEHRDEECLARYLQSCTLAGLPLLDEIRRHSEEKKLTDFLRRSREMLATLAIFVENARLDEQKIENQNVYNIVRDIRSIEENGVYHMLCSMDIALKGEHFRQISSPIRCSEPGNQATADNRNYIILHALEKYLEAVESRLEPIRAFIKI